MLSVVPQLLGLVFGTFVDQLVKTDKRYFAHCCCEKGSLLSNPVNGATVKIQDATKEQDFTNQQNTAQDIIRKLRGP